MPDYTMDLRGKTAIVSGASGVIGGVMARALMHAGANVALIYNSNRMPVDDLLAQADGRQDVRAYSVDYLDPAQIARHADQVQSDFGAIDILINCAGGHLSGTINEGSTSFFDLDPLQMERNTTFNLYSGCIWPCYYYGRHMVRNEHGGSIVNISSMNAYRPLRGRASYAAAKSGVTNFTQWFAGYVAREFNNKLRVNCIAPGFFPGPHNLGSMANADGSLAWRGKQIVAQTPMGRLGAPEDIVGAMLFYVSDLSRYVTGTMLPVDGGFTSEAGL